MRQKHISWQDPHEVGLQDSARYLGTTRACHTCRKLGGSNAQFEVRIKSIVSSATSCNLERGVWTGFDAPSHHTSTYVLQLQLIIMPASSSMQHTNVARESVSRQHTRILMPFAVCYTVQIPGVTTKDTARLNELK